MSTVRSVILQVVLKDTDLIKITEGLNGKQIKLNGKKGRAFIQSQSFGKPTIYHALFTMPEPEAEDFAEWIDAEGYKAYAKFA